ncbi:uncharacterized protein LOC125228628 [Leguminivora glycinivorella]|uniref:uncharacterized protein LOC125228628 n=1 Tax=Leguminivora glycinivorella TaxID=1035111 RepID=UPI00200FE39D|nr:uncharacterized protein LOC125228628 [Leguminivora glycinivorella]
MPPWNTNYRKKATPRIKWYNLQKPQGRTLASNIADFLDTHVTAGKDVNTAWNDFQSHITNAAKEVLGTSTGKLKPNKDPNWWNEDVKSFLQEKKLCFKKWQASKDESDHQRYIEAKKLAKRMVACSQAAAKENEYIKLEKAGSDKEIFQIAKFRNKQSKDIKHNKYIKDSTGALLTSDNDINDRWHEYYNNLLNEEFPQEPMPSLPLVHGPIDSITQEEVKAALTKMKNGKATGPDEIPSDLLKMTGSAEMKMLRWSGGVTLKDRVRNEYIRGTFKVACITDKLQENRLRWYGHVMRRNKEHMTRVVMEIEEPKRGPGRRPTTWMGTISKDMKTTDLKPETAQKRPEWRLRTRRADPKRHGK